MILDLVLWRWDSSEYCSIDVACKEAVCSGYGISAVDGYLKVQKSKQRNVFIFPVSFQITVLIKFSINDSRNDKYMHPMSIFFFSEVNLKILFEGLNQCLCGQKFSP